ncbi:hypothetical protein HUN58_14955 [Curtobacterium sp. Csp1]|uniref:DUF7255 family protein n=1 Tax=unclassified Curtobacterium TaxID=257496 RepID=UPI00159AA32D|nr:MULTISPECIES: hypothetical protein [unclassified Curtobacterium]QKS13977.1 hypothetical protein HUN60_13250 [Curtobacterium sp. csp3]QKS21051.1 hypothetical protein HUN58_14955 [Curtobacterium sp. Csp1]
MTRTGARAAVLDDALVRMGFTRTPRPAAPRLPDLTASIRTEILDLYRSLGGLAPEPQIRPGPWDLSYGDVVVELDEDFHFNRYRTLTLLAPFASTLPWAVDYRRHSTEQEHRSGTGGRRWTNPSAERMFGSADAEMVFLDVGAPRWKQRALSRASSEVERPSPRRPCSASSSRDPRLRWPDPTVSRRRPRRPRRVPNPT